jgi:hypothetical protein
MYNHLHPLDHDYAKALQLISSRTDLAWKYLKEGNHRKAANTIDLIGEVADDFLTELELAAKAAAKAKTSKARKTVSTGIKPKASAKAKK